MPAEGTSLPVVGEEIAGKYRVESVLGQGGMGAVFAARNLLTGKRVAIKWLLPEHANTESTRERLLREARIAASIDHPNVVDIYDVGEHQGGLFLVMEYLRGRPLSELLVDCGQLDADALIALLVPAMRGVHAAHQAGVVHRDLKPENIILSESDGQIVPKVVDFGVSKSVAAGELPVSALTRTGALVGTPHYMALEQVDGSNAIDARTDVYAFGVLLYRALSGQYPFDGTSLGEVILKIGTKQPLPLSELRPDLPAELARVVMRALARDRSARFPEVEALARALLPFATRGGALPSAGDSLCAPAPGAVGFGAALRLGAPSRATATPPLSADREPTTAPAVPRAALRTPVLLARRRHRRTAIGATLLLSLLAFAVVALRPTPRAAAPSSAEPAVEIPASASVSPVVAASVVPVVPEPPPPHQEVTALTGPVAEEVAVAPLSAPPGRRFSLDSDAAVLDAAVVLRAGTRPRGSVAKRAAEASAVPRPDRASRVIPGERTQGLSVDEF